MNDKLILKMSGCARFIFAALLTCLVGNVTAAASGPRYYVNDHLATTVGIADAAGEIAAMEADAFGSPLVGGGNSGRYTGKPYDEDLGAYVFPFRNYRADEARWMSADPSGFPDGVNGRLYAPRPLTGIDPFGLASKVTLSTFVAEGSYGGLSFSNKNTSDLLEVGDPISLSRGVVDFNLGSGHTQAGWIVQKVDFNYSYKTSATADTTNWTISYWEAWGVSVLPWGEVLMVPYGRDTFETQDFSGTYSGSATITGKAYFQPYSGDLQNNPDTWSSTAVSQSGGLPAVLAGSAPAWLSSANGITHKLSLEWKE
jgi:RHS repeat-associated protein